ncbi:hypothetical protein HYH03_001205 [Edaphochlamys debaryana]|uniref:Uncharacterized protein n=1 Tax=Edaphochlamys debaryana TaxID=47281 RepID=A0A835YEI7_9CHLO|nr:hypothetical protein HYH03_001205 [Edaphochlamys debaryana]|eukprot:KAG2501422.1 hypothetical protein HYH03_001205 [Edaphochlamys debaryana]
MDRAVDGIKEAFQANASVYYILLASVVELTAACILCDETNYCKSYNGYAVALGTISTFLALMHAILCSFKPVLADKFGPFISTFLVLWWIPGAGVCTFRNPFLVPGNGYYACWIALLASLVFWERTGLALFSGSRKSASAEPQPNQV